MSKPGQLPFPYVSATVGPNAKTNRIHTIRARARGTEPPAPVDTHRDEHAAHGPTHVLRASDPENLPPRVGRPPVYRQPKQPKYFAKDLSTRGREYRQVCISIPKDDLAAIDEVARRTRMARSELLRRAALEFIAPKGRK